MIQIKNNYQFELVDSQTGEVKQTVECHNTVLSAVIENMKKGAFYIPNTISLGTATGIIWRYVTDASEGLSGASNVLTVTYPTAKRVLKLTVAASQANGALTSCYLGQYGSWNSRSDTLLTSALFTDAEGNPIVINKTATDILNVTVTVQYVYTHIQHPKEGTEVFMCPGDKCALFNNLIGNYGGMYAGFSMYAASKYDERQTKVNANSDTATGTTLDGVANRQGLKLLYNNGDGHLGWEIRSLFIAGLGAFNITETSFPPAPFPKYQVGVGDGTNKEFHIKTPSCKEGTQKVYINSVLKTEGVDYTFYPYNVKDFMQNWLSGDRTLASYPPEGSSHYSWDYMGGPFYPSVYNWDQYKTTPLPVVFDFLQAKTVNAVIVSSVDGQHYQKESNNVKIEYSTDGTTWAVFTPVTGLAVDTPVVFPEVTARYWRITGNAATYPYYSSTGLKGYALLFGYYKPSIVFTVAPGVNDVVEIEYSLKYPFKNDRYTISAGYTYEFNVG